jgi:hypothetical protein
MTVAAAIEIGSGGTQTPGLNKTQGAAQSSALATVANQGLSQPIASGTESFRAGWQSLLASLGSDVEGFSQTEGEENQEATFAAPTLTDAAGKSSATALPSAVGACLRTRQGTEKGTGPANAGLNLAQTDARTVSSAVRFATDLNKTATSTKEEKRTFASLEPKSPTGSRRAHSVKATEPEVTAAVPLPEMVTATLAAIPQAVAIIAVPNPVTHSTDDAPQPALERSRTDILRDLFVDPSTGLASDKFSSHSLNLDPLSRTAIASAQKEVSRTEVSLAAKGVVPPVGSYVEAENTPPASGIPTQAATLDLAKVQASSEDQPLANSANLAKPLSASQVPPQTQALDQSEVQTQLGAKALPVAQYSGDMNPLSIAANVTASGQLPAVFRNQGQPAPASEKKISASDPVQPTRETERPHSVQHGIRFIEEQSSTPAADAPPALHLITGVGGVTSTSIELPVNASTATGGPDSREAFATLDTGGTTGKPIWIHAGAQRAEAGFQDPALGWVGVRADTSGGGVHAELVAGSADAAQTLGGHLAGLSAYLAEHHTQVETLTLSSSESGWTTLDSGKGSGDGMQQGSGHQTGQEKTQGADSGAHVVASSTTAELPVWSVGRDGNAQAVRLEGNHISVMA